MCYDTVAWIVCRIETHWSPWSEWQAAPTLASNLLHADNTLRPTKQPETDQLFNAAILFYKWPRSGPESAHGTWKSYTSLMAHLFKLISCINISVTKHHMQHISIESWHWIVKHPRVPINEYIICCWMWMQQKISKAWEMIFTMQSWPQYRHVTRVG